MKAVKTNSIFKKVIFFFIIILFNINVAYAYIWHNGAGSGYGGGGESNAQNAVIEYYIIEGGAFYLAADSDAQRLLELVELQDIQGVDIKNLQAAADDALYNINKAIERYEALLKTAEITPYNETFIHQLKTFDYESFELENSLNSIVFNQVRAYLQEGDITGLFRRVHADLKGINEILTEIHAEISLNRMPETSKFWQLNETFASVSLFGSYTARVFGKIR